MNQASVATAPAAVSRRHRSARIWIVVGLILITAILATALLTRPSAAAVLDPRSAAPEGSAALAQVLAARGEPVGTVTTLSGVLAADQAHTVVVRNDAILTTQAAERLTTSVREHEQRLVVLGVAGPLLQDRWEPSTATTDPVLAADCTLPAAAAAQTASFPLLVQPVATRGVDDWEHVCFSQGPAAGLLAQGQTFLMSDGSALSNAELAEVGNAALGVNLLSAAGADSPTGQERIVWYLPTATDPALATSGSATLSEVLPTWLPATLMMTLIGVVVLALWRGRRLGPLLTEDLPVLVQSYETQVGRANLMQRNQDRNGAAEALRMQSREQLQRTTGRRHPETDASVLASTAAAVGLTTSDVATALQSGPVSTDAELLRLARNLQRILGSAPDEEPPW